MTGLLAPLLAQALTLTLGDDSDLRARVEEKELSWDVTTIPNVTLRLDTRKVGYSLSYAPSISFLSIGTEDESTTVLHNVNLTATARFKRTTAALNQYFSMGTTNYRLDAAPALTGGATEPEPEGPEPGAPPTIPPGQQGSVNEVVTVGSSTTSLGLAHVVTRRSTINEYASYTMAGGLNEPSRQAYPLQRGFGAGLGYVFTPGQRDTLSTNLTGDVVYTDPDVRSLVTTLRESWGRSWSSGFVVTVGVGATYLRTDRGAQTEEALVVDVGPVGSLSATYRWGAHGANYALTATVGSTPAVDRFTGYVDPRVLWLLSLSRSKRRLTLEASATGAHSTDPDSIAPLSTVGGSVGAFYQLTDELALRAGGSASVEVISPEDDHPPPLWLFYVGFSFSTQPIRL